MAKKLRKLLKKKWLLPHRKKNVLRYFKLRFMSVMPSFSLFPPLVRRVFFAFPGFFPVFLALERNVILHFWKLLSYAKKNGFTCIR